MSKPNEQKDSPANEELNLPCPQCGGKVKQKPHNLGHECTDCEMDLYDDYRLWWCYREIAEAKEQLSAKEQELATVKELSELRFRDLYMEQKRNWDLKKEINELLWKKVN